MTSIHIRAMTRSDIDDVAGLSGELGYPSSRDDIARRFDRMCSKADHAMLVAVSPEGTVAGWIQVHPVHTLESEAYAEIGGLVVGVRFRRHGAGRALVAEAEHWAREQGFALIRVRSNVVRPEAHRFYPGVGFELVKTQHTYGKAL
jgi:GNAT superfamily N-acetyltransferase